MTERVHALIRVGQGDYLLPSNDGRTLLRVYRYREDGSAEYEVAPGRWRKVYGSFWGYARFYRQLRADRPIPDDVLDWGEQWQQWGSGYRTRAEAITDALAPQAV